MISRQSHRARRVPPGPSHHGVAKDSSVGQRSSLGRLRSPFDHLARRLIESLGPQSKAIYQPLVQRGAEV